MKRWLLLAVVSLVLLSASVTTALAPVDLLPGEEVSALSLPRPVTSGEVDRTGYVKAFYVSAAALTSADFVARMEELLETTELNGVVLDFKSDYGYLSFPTEVPLALEIGADDRLVTQDPTPLLDWFEARNVYTIARIVTLKDDVLANAYPGWAVMDANTGGVWHDHEGMGWVDGMQPATWDYNAQLAAEAARMGFNEVQLDYVRFPTDGNMSGARFSQANTYENRSNAIAGLLRSTKAALAPTGTKLGADVFGYTAWVNDDLGIGQQLEIIAPHLDVIAPMVYPSTYNAGLPGEDTKYHNPVAYPYDIIHKSVVRAISRAQAANPAVIVRPWLQDFKDYAFDGRTYTAAEIRLQIEATRDAGGRGWMMWDPAVRYTSAALVTSTPSYAPDARGDVPVLAYSQPEAAASDPAVAEQSAQALRSDLDWLREQGFYPANLSDLASGGLRSIPAGKRALVLTFDGASSSLFRLLPGGAIDPLCTVGVLLDYTAAHPADWPARGTFFIQPTGDNPGENVFGAADMAKFKLETLLSWGFEIGVEPVGDRVLDQLEADGVKQALGQAQQRVSSWLPDYTANLLALPEGVAPRDPALLAAGTWGEVPYSFAGAVLPDGGLAPSPAAPTFNPHRIPRIPAGMDAGSGWRDLLMRPRLYVSGGE